MAEELTPYQILKRIADMNDSDWNITHQHQLIQVLDELSQQKSRSRYLVAVYEQELRNYLAEKTLELKSSWVKMTEKQIEAVLQLDEVRREYWNKVNSEKYGLEQVTDKVEVCRNLITLVRDVVKPTVYPVLT